MVLNLKALVGAFHQEKALVGAFSMITNLGMDLFVAQMKAVVIRNIAGGIIAVIIGTLTISPPKNLQAEQNLS